MIDALFTLATYTAIALSLLGMAVVLGAMVLEALNWGGDDPVSYDDTVEFTDWAEWDWPIPDDIDGWDFPEKDAA